jgi:RimJ/RimL family protein N-acetyltransferase
MILLSDRLILRPWREDDLAPFAALNADPAVMRHFPATLSRAESDAFVARIEAHRARHGFGFWAVERRDSGALAGMCGLAAVAWDAWFTPAVEIGWRFAAAHQRQGLAEEAARLALADGFGRLGLAEIVAFTIPANARSRALMARLGLREAGSFDHPRLPVGHAMRRHLLHRLPAAAFAG